MSIREYTLLGGAKKRHGDKFTYDDQQYPSGWLENATTADLESRGITSKIIPDRVVPLTEVKINAKEQIGIQKRRNQDEPFTHNGIVFQNDPRSRQLILGAAVMALLANMVSTPWTIDWTAADDSAVTLNADQMIAMGIASGKHVSDLHSTARTTKGQIDSAVDAKSVQDILDAGAPAVEEPVIK